MFLGKATRLHAANLLALALGSAVASSAADLPTAKTIGADMGFAWNIGNSMEVPKDPTAWGNPLPSQRLIDSAKAAGFKTIRIPCAWDSHADASTNTISAAWLAQVKSVVDYCIKDGLYVVLNSHWDGGWLEEHIDAASQTAVKGKQGAYWRQIATAFKDYDQHLLFAGANEPAVQDAYGTAFGADRIAVLNAYLQTFIDSVRATGGNNATRTLIIQGPHADIELAKSAWTTLPKDKVADRLMVELHFYPYQWALMEKDESWGKVFWYWGKENLSTTETDRNTTWCGEAFVDSEFTILKRLYVDKGMPVLLGEFGAVKRMSLTGESLTRHIQSRLSYYKYVLASAKSHGIIPAAWDAGGKGDLTMTVLDRTTGAVFDLPLLNAIRQGWGLPPLSGDTSTVPKVGANAMKVLYSAKDSLWGQVELGVPKPNFSAYDTIVVRALVKGTSNYDSAGVASYGYLSLNLVTMSKSWNWREATLGTLAMNTWTDYKVAIGTDTTSKSTLVPADPTKIDFFALQAYSKAFRGAVYVDHILFKSKSGTVDTLYSFNQTVPGSGKGNVESVSMVPVASVAADEDWKSATTSKWTTSVHSRQGAAPAWARIARSGGRSLLQLDSDAGPVRASLRSPAGVLLWSAAWTARDGSSTLELPALGRGIALLQLEQDGKVRTSHLALP